MSARNFAIIMVMPLSVVLGLAVGGSSPAVAGLTAFFTQIVLATAIVFVSRGQS